MCPASLFTYCRQSIYTAHSLGYRLCISSLDRWLSSKIDSFPVDQHVRIIYLHLWKRCLPFIDRALFLPSQTRMRSSSSSPERVSVICLTVNNGGRSRLALSRRSKLTCCSNFLLVEMPSDNCKDGGREELLAMYEAAAAATTEKYIMGNNYDDGRQRNLLVGSLPYLICPYFGVLRVRVGTEAGSSRPQGSTDNHGRLLSPTRPDEGRQKKGRFFLALGDPREGMRSPCTLTIKIEASGDASSVRPLQVQTNALSSAARQFY